ncbi:anaphase-promoting complex subunit 2-like [Phaenicophaeus curvirostris]|uniref:anaphase-promoting complex subunit 2-like n=1 Tax=Phaenicophaeus curvirostris TaxID=33595 RepID=UPI0037F0C8CD
MLLQKALPFSTHIRVAENLPSHLAALEPLWNIISGPDEALGLLSPGEIQQTGAQMDFRSCTTFCRDINAKVAGDGSVDRAVILFSCSLLAASGALLLLCCAEPTQDAELRAALGVLRCYDLHSVVEEWFLEVLQTDLQANIAPEFWNCINQYENAAEEPQCSALLLDAFCLLKCRLEPYLNSLELLERWTEAGLLLGTGAQTLQEKVYTMFRAILFFTTTKSFQEMIQQFYSRTFRIYMRQWRKGEDGTNEGESSMSEAEQESDTEEGGGEAPLCAGCSTKKEQCWCPQAMEQFQQLNDILYVGFGVVAVTQSTWMGWRGVQQQVFLVLENGRSYRVRSGCLPVPGRECVTGILQLGVQ